MGQLQLLMGIGFGCVILAAGLAHMFADPGANPFRSPHKASAPASPPAAASPRSADAVESAPTYPRSYPGYTVTGPVERIRWSKKKRKEMALAMQQRGTPVIIENSVAKKWKALKAWDLDYLERATPDIVTGVYYHNTEPRFGPLFRSKKPMSALETVKWANPHQLFDMPKSEFFAQVVRPKRAANGSVDYLYYTGNLNSPDLLNDLHPYNDLLLTPDRAHVILWVGQAGVIAHTHLDSYDNFFVQLRGRKRFLLFEPAQAEYLHPYPFLHPSHAQAQVDIHNASHPGVWPEMQHIKCIEAVLGPGDMLYLPPLWWHMVEALDVSVSVNLWSVGKQQDAFDSILQRAVKTVNHEWPRPAKRAVAGYLITQVLNAVGKQLTALRAVSPAAWESSDNPARAFVNLLVQERYQKLVEAGELPRSSPSQLSLTELCSIAALPDDAPSRLEGLIEDAVDTFALRSPSPGHRHWWLGNFVETFVYWGLGTGTDATPYILDCLANS